MTGMEHAIERAARIIRDGDPEGMGYAQAHNIASALAEAGLLAPAPLREEWTVIYVDPPYGTSIPMDELHARSLATRNDTLTRRYVTDPEVVR